MKTFVVVLLATLCAASGEALLSVGMKQFGDVSAHGTAAPWRMVGMFANPRVLVGVFLMLGFFSLYSAALSWADLSFVQPLTAMTFVFGALIARYMIGEQVSAWRWAGIALIVMGVVVLSRDPSQLTVGRP